MDRTPCASCNGSGKIEISRWIRRAALPYLIIFGVSGGAAVLAGSSPKNGPGSWRVVGGGCAVLLLALYWLEGGIITLFHRLYQFYRWTFRGQAPDCGTCGGRGFPSEDKGSPIARKVFLWGVGIVVLGFIAAWVISRGWFKV
jgi:hypothetical protein